MNCTTFQNQFGEIAAQAKIMDKLIQSHLNNPTPDTQKAAQDAISKTAEAKNKLWSDYLEKAREMLGKSYLMLSMYGEDAIEFEDSGRVAINVEMLVLGVLPDYFPSIIRKVNGKIESNSATKVTSLDYLEEANEIVIRETNISSLARLRNVDRFIFFHTPITTLPMLEKAGMLRTSDFFASAPKLKEADQIIFPNESGITFKEVFPELKKVRHVGLPTYELQHEVRSLKAGGELEVDHVTNIHGV